MPEQPRPRPDADPARASGRRDEADAQAARGALQAAVIRSQAVLLSRQAADLDRLEAGAGVGLWSCRLRDAALDWSAGTYDLFGVARGLPLQRPRIVELFDPSSRRLLEAVRARAIAACGGFRMDAEILTPHGARRWIRIVAAVEARAGRAIRLHGTKQDVTAEVERLAALSRRADLDPLTGLANRRAFDARSRDGRPGADPQAGPGALLLIDLDGFKQINDTHGHAAGDACIRETAARLVQVCRGTDLVARLGGDEFAVLVSGPVAPAALAALGRRIVAALGCPIDHGGTAIRVGASVGIARAGADTPCDLFARADAALYAAKASGRNAVRIDGADG